MKNLGKYVNNKLNSRLSLVRVLRLRKVMKHKDWGKEAFLVNLIGYLRRL